MAFIPTTPQAVIVDLSTIAGFFSATKKADIVRVLDQQSMTQVFNLARPLDADVNPSSSLFKYPVETGSTLTDDKVDNQTEINMKFSVPATAYATVYQAMWNARVNAQLLVVQTKVGTFKNMLIERMPHQEKPEISNAIIMDLKFVEAIYVSASAGAANPVLSNYSPASPQSALTQNQGLVSGLAAGAAALSYLHAASVVGL